MKNNFVTQAVFEIMKFIPRGKVLTYKEVANTLEIKNPRLIGKIIHPNKDPRNFPCHRIVKSDGKIASGYGMGGRVEQIRRLKEEGIIFDQDERTNLNIYFWQINNIFKTYFLLLKNYGFPGKWPWFERSNDPSTTDQIIFGSILTQNTNWDNVERALSNFKKGGVNTLNDVYRIGEVNFPKLKEMIRPAGFYNQKSNYLFNLSKIIIRKYKNLENFKKLKTPEIREFLLNQKGVGKETADTILLYAMELPVFIIDSYTKRFTKAFSLTNHESYDQLQELFKQSLPEDIDIFQNYHALIVRWGKI